MYELFRDLQFLDHTPGVSWSCSPCSQNSGHNVTKKNQVNHETMKSWFGDAQIMVSCFDVPFDLFLAIHHSGMFRILPIKSLSQAAFQVNFQLHTDPVRKDFLRILWSFKGDFDGFCGTSWCFMGILYIYIPSGKLTVLYGKSPFSMGKSTINHHFPQLCQSLPEG